MKVSEVLRVEHTTITGRTVQVRVEDVLVELTVSVSQLMKHMGEMAAKNKSGHSLLLGGLVSAHVIDRALLDTTTKEH